MSVTLLRSVGYDIDVANGARVSLNRTSAELTAADEGLIRRLVKDGHTEPLRGVWAKFRIVCSIGAARQVMTCKRYLAINERSTRYSEFEDRFVVPALKRQVGKPMEYAYEPLSTDDFNQARDIVDGAYRTAYRRYQELLQLGVSREDARSVLPLGTETVLIVSGDLVAWLRFLSRRTHPHAQDEIRQDAIQIERHLGTFVPVTMTAWAEHGRRAL